MRLEIKIIAAAIVSGCALFGANAEAQSRLDAYVGRYAVGPLDVATVSTSQDLLVVTPPFWQSAPGLTPIDGETDAFSFTLPEVRPDRRIRFTRDPAGAVIALKTEGVDARVDGLGVFRRLPVGEVAPIDLILSGAVTEGVAAAREAGATDHDLLGVAARLLRNFPSRAGVAADLLERLTPVMPQSADVQVLLGNARMVTGDREGARAAYARAIDLQPGQADAALNLARLDGGDTSAGDGYRRFFPYPLDALFAPPFSQEIAAVRADWARRDLAPSDIVEAAPLTVDVGGTRFVAHVFRHAVHGQTHVSVVFVPVGAAAPLPVVIDARGTDPDFTPLNLDHGSRAMRQLGSERAGFVFVVPAFRGETVVLAGQTFKADGDPVNGWDGATDDAIASLSVALERISQADPTRIVAFGQSRGGAVALLMGIRDPRVALVFAQSAPADWFTAMNQDGWRTSEVLRAALADGIPPTPREAGGQFYQRILQPVHEGELDLQGARLRMLASSPAYFSRDLRRAVILYGREDRSVPVANAIVMERAIQGSPDARVVVFPDRGHDLDITQASAMLIEALRALEVQQP